MRTNWLKDITRLRQEPGAQVLKGVFSQLRSLYSELFFERDAGYPPLKPCQSWGGNMAKQFKLFIYFFLLVLLIVIFISCSLVEKKTEEAKITKEDLAPPPTGDPSAKTPR